MTYAKPKGLFIEEEGKPREVETVRVLLGRFFFKSIQTRHSKSRRKQAKKEKPKHRNLVGIMACDKEGI